MSPISCAPHRLGCLKQPAFFFLLVCCLSILPLSAQGALPGREPAAITPSQGFDFGENNPDVYLCMGDSITFGAGVGSGDSYPVVLQHLLGKTVINEGVSGSRSTLGEARVNGLLQRYKPGYLLILYGVNDIGERGNADILESLRSMVRAAKANQTVPVVATLTPVFGPRGWKTRAVMDLNQRIRGMATEEGILLVDLEEAFDWDASLISDNGIHPNKDGYFLLAKTFFDTLKEDSGSSGGGGCVVGGGKGSYDLLILLGFLGLYAAWSVSKRSRRPTRLDQHQNHDQHET
ncbi:MAG: SGNH/GDSL hydrolase family protein [Desulfovibrionales bacterium]|nr:MAG: SGNH/GDSL hydrolase family protein [Desulfovibrionales bacterium]